MNVDVKMLNVSDAQPTAGETTVLKCVATAKETRVYRTMARVQTDVTMATMAQCALPPANTVGVKLVMAPVNACPASKESGRPTVIETVA